MRNFAASVSKPSGLRIVLYGFMFIFSWFGVSAYADGIHAPGIATDGSIAPKMNLPGPNYEIKAEFGRQSGANLFHSFQQFNVHKGESATFSGPDSVQNIISRVTGGSASWIDGLLRSAIPGANLYFLNPAGVMFGANASLDLSGSFHVSTADYLKMGEDEKFFSQPLENEILSVAPPTAFGFLSDRHAPVQVTDSRLAVLPGKTLSLTGGDLSLINTQTPTYDEAGHPAFTGQLLAPGGRIVMDAQGKVSLENFGVDASGLSGGQISIRADRLEMKDSRISSHTFGDMDGQGIDIQTDNLFMQDSDIIANTYGAGRGSGIRLNVDETLTATRYDRPLGVEFGMSLLGTSHICTMTAGQGDIGAGGDISVNAGNIDLRDAAEIRTRSFSQGKSGNITLQVAGDFQAAGVIPLSSEAMPIFGGVNTFGLAAGGSGDIDVTARNILLDKGGQINASTMYSAGGSVSVQADTIRIQNEAELAGIASTICSMTIGTGQAGRIDVEARQITLENGGTITSATAFYGNANEMTVRVSDTLTLSGAAKKPFQLLGFPEIPYVSFIGPVSADMSAEGGQGSNVYVEAGHIVMNDGAGISAMTFGGGDAGSMEVVAETIRISGWHDNGILYRSGINGTSASPESYAGQAGDTDVTAKTITIDKGGAVSTSAVNAGGGNISIHAEDMIYLSDQGAITTSVHSGIGDGGNISIENPQFIVMNNGEISAQADEGHGGNIDIAAENFFQSADSVVSASSLLGIDGNIDIKSPDTDVSGSLTVLPSDPPDSARWLSTPCSQKTSEDISRFVIPRKDGVPPRFDDWLPGQLAGIRWQLSVGSEQLPVNKIQEFLNKGQWAEIVKILEASPPKDDGAILIQETLRSQMYGAMGYYRKSAAILNAALPVAEKADDPALKALYYNCLGDLALCIGSMKDAVTYLKKALEEARKAGNPVITAGVLNNLGNVRAVNRDVSGALKAYQEALALISQSENSESPGSKILINTAHAQLLSGKYENAPVTAENAAEQIRKEKDSFDKAANLISLALFAQKICDHPDSACKEELLSPENLFGQAAQIGEKTGNPRIVSCAYGYLGEYHEARKEYAQALKMTRKAVFAAQQGDFPEILYRWQWAAGRLLWHEQDTEHAIASCQNAAATLNPIRSALSVGSRTRESRFDTEIKPVYLELVQLLLEHADKAETSDSPALLRRAGDVMEQMKKAEIQNFYKDDCLTGESDRKHSDHLPQGTAVMYPISLPESLTLLLLFPDDIKQIRVPANSVQVRETAGKLREKLEAGEKDFQEYAMQLYDWLIRPAEKELDSRNTDTLILVPDGSLCLIPFSALHSGESFLIEKYALGTIPALNLTDTRQTREMGRQILLSGVSEARQDFLPLPNVKNELESVKAVMNGRILLDQDFTVKNLEAEMQNQDYGMVHMATHAVFGDGPDDTFLLTYDDRLTLDHLDRVVGLKKYQEKPLDLLTLSACETAADNERSAFGIAGAALRSGAGSVLATLWKVDDKAASLLIAQFYQNIGTGEMTKAQALRNAQKKLIRDRKFEHPAFWSPFLLIGNWM